MRTTAEDLAALTEFIGRDQLTMVRTLCRGEESGHFKRLVRGWADCISKMPKTYETDGMGEEARVVLHYFKGGADWFIIERDQGEAQLQAFGLADLFGDGGELGYISIEELCEAGVEFDLYWEPKSLHDVRQRAHGPGFGGGVLVEVDE